MTDEEIKNERARRKQDVLRIRPAPLGEKLIMGRPSGRRSYQELEARDRWEAEYIRKLREFKQTVWGEDSV